MVEYVPGPPSCSNGLDIDEKNTTAVRYYCIYDAGVCFNQGFMMQGIKKGRKKQKRT